MGYYMRYIVTDEQRVSLSEIERALRAIDPHYLVGDGDLKHDDGLYGQLEINQPGDGLFEEEVDELKAELEDTRGKAKKKVEAVLENAKAVVAIQVLWQDRDIEETLKKIDPLWKWLFANRQGLLQADGEGWYDASGLILRVR